VDAIDDADYSSVGIQTSEQLGIALFTYMGSGTMGGV
jgi:hypothetical protein